MKNKIISILCIFILISFLFINNNVFASSGFIVPDGVDNYIIAERYPHNDENYYVLLYSEYGSYWKVYGHATDFFTIMCYEDENFTKAVNFKRVFIRVDENDFTVPVNTQESSANFAIYNDVLYSTVDIYDIDGSILFTSTNDSNTDVPDYDAWYDSIFSGISDWVGTLLEMLVNPFGAIADGIVNLGKHFSSVLDFLNPTSENFILKQVWDFLISIINYLNPFSEDFFAYKLVEILLDGLKGLFVPEDNYFSDYFNELNSWFSERLGFLYYPLELLFDLLNRMLNIDFKLPIINIPDIKEPTTNITLIKATSFNFNSLLENSVFSSVHNIYLLIVDSSIYIGLVALLMKKYEEVMTK